MYAVVNNNNNNNNSSSSSSSNSNMCVRTHAYVCKRVCAHTHMGILSRWVSSYTVCVCVCVCVFRRAPDLYAPPSSFHVFIGLMKGSGAPCTLPHPGTVRPPPQGQALGPLGMLTLAFLGLAGLDYISTFPFLCACMCV